MPVPSYVFADTDMIDIRRFCGYPAIGTGIIVFPYPWWFKYYTAMEVRMQNLTANEATVVQNYLGQLRGLETAIPAAAGNLDTAAAAVWTWNRNEVRDRERLFDGWRRRLCGFLGIPTGPDLAGGGGLTVVV